MWTRDEATRVPDPSKLGRFRLVKQLARLWDGPGGYTQNRVLLLDDNPHKAGRYSDTNLLHIPTFVPTSPDQPLDTELLRVLDTIAIRLPLVIQ